MPTQDELTAIADRLKQGYFLKADMDTLGMNGYVSLDDVRARVKTLLTPVVAAPADPEQERMAKLQAQQEAELKAQQERMAILAQQEAERQRITDQKQVQDTVDRFQAAIQNDPHVKQTTP